MKFLEDYKCTINYHLGKANIVVDVLSQKAKLARLMMKEWTLLKDVNEWNPRLQ